MDRKKTIIKLYSKVIEFDQKSSSPFNGSIFNSIARAVANQTPLQFAVFTCSTINSQYLFSAQPWKYVSVKIKGNNLEPDIRRLGEIIRKLREIYPQIKLKIIIGNTDPYYIYLEQFVNFSPEQRTYLLKMFALRWKIYRQRLRRWAIRQSGLRDIEVISWHETEKKFGMKFEKEFNKILVKIDQIFVAKDFNWEFRKISRQFGPGKYFAKLARPSKKLLREWIRRKFSEYAIQGRWIYQLFPGVILIQNEKPSDLRSKMYQPLVKEKYRVQLPIVHFLGVDNSGYR